MRSLGREATILSGEAEATVQSCIASLIAQVGEIQQTIHETPLDYFDTDPVIHPDRLPTE